MKIAIDVSLMTICIDMLFSLKDSSPFLGCVFVSACLDNFEFEVL